MLQFVFIVALIVFVAAVFWLVLRNASAKISSQYEQLSKQLGLEHNQPPAKMGGFLRPEPSLYGEYRGREVSVSVPGKGLQNTRQVETVLKVEVRNLPFNAQLTATGPLAGMRQRDSGGLPRWKSGDAAFDGAVDARTDQGEALGDLLDDGRRIWLAKMLRQSKGTLYIGKNKLVYARLGLIADEKTRRELEAAVEFLCDLAKTIEA
ncbi:MAG: hypothetical protein GVY36_13280 [Verrucomicrobia bacterium]|jgi:hypothetical protein|nr:hypothetical protein [Verrucomicrobiota bacterium]